MPQLREKMKKQSWNVVDAQRDALDQRIRLIVHVAENNNVKRTIAKFSSPQMCVDWIESNPDESQEILRMNIDGTNKVHHEQQGELWKRSVIHHSGRQNAGGRPRLGSWQ
jgi:P2-related tail formation protein